MRIDSANYSRKTVNLQTATKIGVKFKGPNVIGNKEVIAIEVGDKVKDSSDLFLFEIWFLGRHVTCVDNIAYLKAVVAQAEDDVLEDRDFHKHSAYFSNMTPIEAHNFILSTRDSESPNWDIEDDTIYLNHRVLDWGAKHGQRFVFFNSY